MTDNIKNKHLLPPIAHKILDRIHLEFPARLTYHGKHHTEEVIEEIITLGLEDKLNSRDLEILIVAAAFHDAGFLYKGGQNEDLGAKLAEMEMKKDGSFTEEEIKEVSDCILSTKLGKDFFRKAKSDLSRYLMDADVGNLGRDDFFEKTEQLIQELELETKTDRDKFLNRSMLLLETHKWLTPAANRLREEGRKKNLIELKKLIAQIQ